MKLEKRSGGQPSEMPKEESLTGKKPVLIYIMVLFIAAFLLMALSFASHQRSNTEALGRLQSSVSAMQEVQAHQDQIIQLQNELAEVRKELETIRDSDEALQTELEAAQKETEALLALYVLQQHYAYRDYDACRQDLAGFEANDYLKCLPEKSENDVTPPAERYQELKSAVEAVAVG